MKRKLIVTLFFSCMMLGCATTKDGESVFPTLAGTVVGAAVGGFVGNKLDRKLGTGHLFTSLGAGLFGVLGGKLANQLTTQDKENIVTILNDTDKSQTQAWCSDSKDISSDIENVNCKDSNKVIATAGDVTINNQGLMCRTLKTEIPQKNGKLEAANQTLCQDKNGKWNEKPV